MAIEMPAGRYISRLFYTELKVTRPGNLLGYTYRDPGEPVVWHYDYRFRYYVDEKLDYTSKDIKNWYAVQGPPGGPIEAMMPVIRQIFSVAGGGTFDEIVIESSRQEDLMKRISEQPWANVSMMTEEQWNAERISKS